MSKKKQPPLEPVFVIGRNGDVLLFKSPYNAEKDLRAVDVLDGAYVEAFTPAGRVLTLGVEGTGSGRTVTVAWSDRHDRARLVQRLRNVAERNGYEGEDPDPREVVNELWTKEWQGRWPTWPRWLDRRLHGDGPPAI